MFQLPRDCRTYSAIDPAMQWGWSEILANKTNYLLETIIWQNATPQTKGKVAAHKAKQPKPFVPDFLKKAVQKSSSKGSGTDMTVDDVKSWLNNKRGV